MVDLGAITTSTTGKSPAAPTLEDVQHAAHARAEWEESDPLRGATVLWVHRDDVETAEKLRAASGNRIRVTVSPNAVSGKIFGFRGTEFHACVMIELRK